MAAVWDDLPETSRAWWRARHLREASTHACGHPREVCENPDKDWFPQLSVCHVSMETQAALARFERLHADAPWHDGTFESWAENPSLSHPYHFSHGVTVWVADTDLGLGGDFLTSTGRSSLENLDGVQPDIRQH